MLKIAICDDEDFFLEKMKTAVEIELNKLGINNFAIETYLSSRKLAGLNENISKYNVIFLDINMQELTGLELAKHIRKYDDDVLIVFVTAFIDYSIEGYKYGVADYLLKDTFAKTLPECIRTIIKRLKLKAGTITMDFLEGRETLNTSQILYFEQ
ncbi:MAG: response regulator [Lachnospiraceae bacterium]|nr:response regulator [Lachnospiraceae bacterium]